MSVFLHRGNVKFPKFSGLFQKYLKQIKILTQQYLKCNYTKFQLKNTVWFSICAKFSKSTQFFVNITRAVPVNRGLLL